MATHSFAYWPNPAGIAGCIKFGNLLVGNPSPLSGYSESPLFWMGPEEDGRYVIATTLQSKDQPTPAPFPNDFAYVTFWATSGPNPLQFVGLAEYCSDWYGSPQDFELDPFAAKAWLETNGFWTNY